MCIKTCIWIWILPSTNVLPGISHMCLYTHVCISCFIRNKANALLVQMGCVTSQQSWLTPPKNVLSGVNEVQWGKIKSTKASGVVQLHAEGSQSRFRNPMPFYLHNNFTNETPELMLHFCTHISKSQWQFKLPSHELGTTYLHHFHRVALWTQAKNLFPRKKTPINTFLLYL